MKRVSPKRYIRTDRAASTPYPFPLRERMVSSDARNRARGFDVNCGRHYHHWCGGSEVRIINAAYSSCGLLNHGHTGSNKLLASFDSEARKRTRRKNDPNFGIGTLAMTTEITRESIAAAETVIRPYVRLTPLLAADLADFGLASAPVALKLEMLQHSGSFKARG